MKRNLWPEHRIKRLIEKQETRDPKLKNLNTSSNNLHYFIGLLATDGNLRSKGYECRLMLSYNDIQLLQCIQNKYGGVISIEKKYKRATLSISYRPFINYLNSIGIRSNKTFNLDMTQYFNKLTKQEKWHFVRGCIDGDGCFSFFKDQKHYRGTFSLCGASEKFMNMMHKFLGESSYIRKNNVIYDIRINGKNIEKVLSNVYKLDNDSLYLKRKYDKYKQITEYHNKDNSNYIRKIENSKEMVDYYNIHGVTETAKHYNVAKSTVYAIKSKYLK